VRDFLKFQKRRELLVGANGEPLSVVAMCVCNEDRSPVVSDEFPSLESSGVVRRPQIGEFGE